jgi:HEAT repeat protein
MAFIRATTEAPTAPVQETREQLIRRLAAAEPDDRRHAARELSRVPDAVAALAARLLIESDARVRDALFASLAEIGGHDAAALVAQSLRSEDAALRGGAVEALKTLADDAIEVLDVMLDDADPDVRILAVEVTRVWPSEVAAPRLRHVLDRDAHVNACAAAVDVATEVGTAELIPSLKALQLRFPDEPFLAFAAEIACSRISGDGRSV